MVQSGIVPLNEIRPATYIGTGKVDEIAGLVKSLEAGIVICDCALSPVQQRNLEKAWGAKVLDRTGLILEIFGRRARTKEGSLQVELAHLTYQRSRLVRSWTHLERQRGGFGFLGGPGESQLEIDRRLIEERIARIEAELEKVKKRRKLHRDSRARVPYPIAALVGYTNAGKSTLFNRVTRASVMEADMLFATLDPTLRAVQLPGGMKIILSDTVGFISDLPTMLVAAFRATLEEVIEADVDPARARRVARGHRGAVARRRGGPARARHRSGRRGSPDRGVEQDRPARRRRTHAACKTSPSASPSGRRPVLVSAVTGEGTEALIAAVEARLGRRRVVLDLVVDPADGAGVSWLHRHTEVMEKSLGDDGKLAMTVRVDPAKAGVVRAKFSALPAH